MMMRRVLWLLLAIGGIAGGPIAAPVATAAEPAVAFLEGLRERGYYDIALDYLAAAEQSPTTPAAFKEVILYEKGATLVQGARLQRDTGLREQQLDEGQKALQQFVASQPNHLLAIATRNQLGNVIVERARIRVERAKKAAPADKQKLHQEARGLYDESAKVFAALVNELRERLKAFPAALDEKKDAARIVQRDQYRQDFLQAQLLVAATREEMSDTLDKGSKDWTAALTAAAEAYKQVYESYRTRLAGLYARMYQGRCLLKLGKYKEASAFFNDLLANPDSPDAFRALKIKVMALAVESWMGQELYVEVINRAGPLVESARPSEERTDDLLSIRLTLARACKAYSDLLESKNARDPQIKQLRTSGRNFVSFVARFPGEYQDPARQLLGEFSTGDPQVAAGKRPEPKNFPDAKEAAKEAIDALQSANLLLGALPARIAGSKSPEKEELQKQLDAAKEQVAKSQAEALHYCRLALRLAAADTEVADLNLVRYLLCYLHYNAGDYFDSAALGEFLARRYPDSQGARPSAKIAMACYLKLYSENAGDDKSFESDRVIGIADYIVQKWPGQPEADEALNTLIPFMIRGGKLQEAQDYLGKIPADSPQRGTAELKTGQALWAHYLETSRQLRDWENGVTPQPADADPQALRAEAETLKTKAKQTLLDGVERMRQGAEMNAIVAAAALSLAQIHVDTNEAPQAIALLEDAKIGPLALVRAGDPAARKEGFPEETYKTALRAYISSLAGSGDAAKTIATARSVMDSLKDFMGQTSDGQRRLVGIYVSLARDLQRQMEIADPSAKKALGLGFETFLKEVAADATELNILNWVAETYRGMGESFGGGLKGLTPEARGYFQRAAETYGKILARGKTDAAFLSPAMATQIQLQLAKTKQGMGDYLGARDIYETILKSNAMLLPVQMDAARLYQEWGGTGSDQADNYLRAIVGARPDAKKKNIIWGWGEIARLTASSPQFRDQFYEARYQLALCRYQYALAQADAAKKQDALRRAKQDISVTVGFYPDLGDKWRPQFDGLLKSIQTALGERPAGLAGLNTTAAVKP